LKRRGWLSSHNEGKEDYVLVAIADEILENEMEALEYACFGPASVQLRSIASLRKRRPRLDEQGFEDV
jgi:hypothetical protein